MFAVNFPLYSPHNDGLNSLLAECVHFLCKPLDSNQLSSLQDFNVSAKSFDNLETPHRLIEKLYEYGHQKRKNPKSPLLNLNCRQSLIDYIIRERLKIRSDLILQLFDDGGLRDFDLWKLSEINEFTAIEIKKIFLKMLERSDNFHQLSLGGINWIYNSEIINGVLREFLCHNKNLTNLRSLKIQQITSQIDFFSLLSSCPNLNSLEIAEPSLNDATIIELNNRFGLNHAKLDVCHSLKRITFPSSIKEQGLILFLAHFTSITHLRCTPFEQLLDLLDQYLVNETSQAENFINIAQKVSSTLKNLKVLSIAHPMSRNMIERLVRHCPKLVEISLELQKQMNLIPLIEATNLEKLELHSCAFESISFIEHIVPILERCGHRIKSLSLINFDHIDLSKCAQYCPNLLTFSAQCFQTITSQNRYLKLFGIKNFFPHLKQLRLRPRPTHVTPIDICLQLIQNANDLEHIECYCCSDLNDEKIDEINRKNSLSYLETLILGHNHQVTYEALCRLVRASYLSNNFVFHDCGLVSAKIKQEQSLWNRQIRQ
ncbi:hypothetical protein SSS_07141 [Sarcoptes scabiei]|uniref:Uncharacterized protein n=1 Tax=Sarcoptes scabiei TaxID=52283 RepID=A0A131ZXA2_SARSC|nr:hypothetical protein SSS_07141 [Sarcoptes scabiei]KPM03436.1 hypothetical protein QR98_0018680 [Sarcoptes scabiei]